MTKTDFEWIVIDKLTSMEWEISGLKWEIWLLHNKFDHLDEKIDNQTFEIKQTVRLQWAYLE